MIKNFFTNNLTLLIILSAIWGSAFIAIKISVEFVNPISIASLRLIIASLFLLIIFFYKKYAFNLNLRLVILITLIGIIGNIIPFFLINWSEQFIQSNTTALLLSVAPIFTLILAPILTRDDNFTLLKFISIIIGLVGVFFIIGFDSISNFTDNESYFIDYIKTCPADRFIYTINQKLLFLKIQIMKNFFNLFYIRICIIIKKF